MIASREVPITPRLEPKWPSESGPRCLSDSSWRSTVGMVSAAGGPTIPAMPHMGQPRVSGRLAGRPSGARIGVGQMRILVLSRYLYGHAPSPRSGIEVWERVLEPAGFELDYASFETPELHEVLSSPGLWAEKTTGMLRAYARRIGDLRSLAEYDAVLVNREAALIGPAWFERYAVGRGLPLIYHLDDPLYVPYRSQANGYLSYLKFFGKVGRLCRMASVVIVNSEAHRGYAQRFNPNVRLVPSVVDGELYSYRERPRASEPVRVGWTGSPTTAHNLAVITGPLREVSRRPDACIELIGVNGDAPLSIPYESVPWQASTEVADLRRFDVGLLPLADTPWNRRKFFLKLVQYMTLGIPAVASPL